MLVRPALYSVFLMFFLLANSDTYSQAGNCNNSDTLNSGILKIANLQPGESLRITKQATDGSSIYLLGEINGGLSGNSLVIGAINNNTGLPIWCRRWHSNPNSIRQANFVMADGAIYVTDILQAASPVLLLSKIDNDGHFLWGRQYDFGPNLAAFKASYIPSINVDGQEVLISFRVDCNSASCRLPSSTGVLEAIVAACFSNDGLPLWAKMFGVNEESENAFFNNRPFGLYKASDAGQYILFSQTSGWPFTTPGNPPTNNYFWAMATQFSDIPAQNNYMAKYFLPNVTGQQYNGGTCLGAGAPSFTRLIGGGFMLYSHNLNSMVQQSDKGFFFCEVNDQLQEINGFIASSKNYPCSSTPTISPSGTILLGTAASLEDSFTIAAIKNNNLLYEKKYPKYVHPDGRFNSTYLSAIETPVTGKLFVFLHNQLSPFTPYTEVFNDNIYIGKPQCSPRNVNETTVASTGVYSHPISWDTVITLQPVGQSIPLTQEEATLAYETNCQIISRCDSIQLIGPDSVCVGQEFNITIRRNTDCRKEIEVFQKGLNAEFVGMISDSVYIMRAGKAGLYDFAARFKDCPTSELAVKTVSGGDDKASPVKLSINDTVLCPGQTISLVAPLGYQTYSWNGGQLGFSNSIVVNAPGLYRVETVSWCGTSSRDSVKVSYDFSALHISPMELNICHGDTATFNLYSDSTLSGYSWLPMEETILEPTDNVFIAWPADNQQYGIQATSKYNCPVLETVRVGIISPPAANGAVENSYDVCKSDSISISAKLDFPKYLWSNGNTGKSTVIAQPGNYSLTVYDSNDCKSTIAFKVLETACRKDIYFPSAFTPNRDGLNDYFKAITTGFLPEVFELKIYNRWGELVFTTRQPASGWDGHYNGKRQPQGSYVWYCKYLFSGQKLITANGSVLLLN